MVSEYPRRLDEMATNLALLSSNVVAAQSVESRQLSTRALDEELQRSFEEGDERLLDSTLYAEPFASEVARQVAPRFFITPLAQLFALHVLGEPNALESISRTPDPSPVVQRAAWQLLGVGAPPATPAANPWNGTKVANLTVIVHGTGAAKDTWWRPTGQFAKDVHGVTGDVYQFDDYFRWTGKNRNADRHQAAAELCQWVDTHLEQDRRLRVIAHSHGGNVAILATRLGLQISQLILLGTPMRTEYVPHMERVDRLDNVYAPQDIVQAPAGTLPWPRGEGRTLGDTRLITNYPIQDGVGSPLQSHSDLHEWSTWTHPQNGLDRLLL